MTSSAGWTERYAAAAMVWDTTPNALVVDACGGLRPGRALDLGAGEGRDAIWLAGRGWDVTAIDLDQFAVGRIASRAALQNVPVNAITANVLGHRFPPAAYDLILLAHRNLPVARLRTLLIRAVPALRPGGRVLVVAPDESNLDAGGGGPQDPDLLASATDVAGVLRAAGLDVRRTEVVRREVRAEVGIQHTFDLVVEALAPVA